MDGAEPPAGPTILITEWSPDVPYLKTLTAAKPAEAYDAYLAARKAFANSPGFYLDCADFFVRTGRRDLGFRILTNIPELRLDDGRLLRICAHRLQQLGSLDLAIDLFEKVARLRPEEPQSFRDLALALADRADASIKAARPADPTPAYSAASADYRRSLELLHKVVMTPWERFDEIEVVALMEANRVIARAAVLPPGYRPAHAFDPRLVKLLDLDVRIVMTWDTDNTDIDLHVTEPSGEECDYEHNLTTIGGHVSSDFTQGYGPEEYCLRRLMPGRYKIRANFFGSGDQSLVGPTTVQATVITHFGRPDETRKCLTLRLTSAKDWVDVGEVVLGP
jgi:hypothetical protein